MKNVFAFFENIKFQIANQKSLEIGEVPLLLNFHFPELCVRHDGDTYFLVMMIGMMSSAANRCIGIR